MAEPSAERRMRAPLHPEVPLCVASLLRRGVVRCARSVRAFGVLGSGCAPGQSCCVVVRGFEDLLELVQVLLHACLNGWIAIPPRWPAGPGRPAKGGTSVAAQEFPASETDADRHERVFRNERTGARFVKGARSDPLDWLDQRVVFGR